MCQSSTSVLSTIPLSKDTVQRRIDEMEDDFESQLVQILSKTDHALQIDESTVRDNEALLMGYVRLVHEKRQKKKCCSLFHCNQTQKPYRYLRLSRISTKLKGYQCRTCSAPPTELTTCNTFGIGYCGAIDICEASISIFHLNFIRENDLLDIVINGYCE